MDYAGQRVQFGQPISKFQAIQFKLADIATELEAARWLTYRAAYLRDAGQPFLKEAAMAKLKASRLAAWAASEAVQIHGGLGYMLESPVARFYCDSRCSRSARAPTRSSTSSSPARTRLLKSGGAQHGRDAADGGGDVVAVGQPRRFQAGA